jgi:hypothetical protein
MPRSVRSSIRVTLAFALTLASIGAQRIAHDLTGKWAFSVVTENGTGTPTVTLRQKGDSVTGTYSSSRMGERPIVGTVRKDTVDFVLKGGEAELRFVGRIVDDNNLEGVLDMGASGQATFTAKRESK